MEVGYVLQNASVNMIFLSPISMSYSSFASTYLFLKNSLSPINVAYTWSPLELKIYIYIYIYTNSTSSSCMPKGIELIAYRRQEKKCKGMREIQV
jgi:hypothetical protein